MSRIPKAMAGLALVALTAVACGSDDGSEPTASDAGTSSAASPSPSMLPPPSDSSSPSASDGTSDDPVPSPLINKAVKPAIKDGFPALVPAGVPAGWTVTDAKYSPKGGGTWHIGLTDPNGAPVTLEQSTQSAATLVATYLPDAKPAGKADLSAYGTGRWNAYTGASGAAIAKQLSGTSVVVVGPDQDTVVTLAQQLLTAEDAGSGDDGG